MLSNQEKTYYKRQLSLHNFGEGAQLQLKNSKVLVVGAGGLASSALQYLAGVGVGTLGIIDGDEVEGHNLHRQTLYDISSIGRKKADVAKEKLNHINPNISIHAYPLFLTEENANDIVKAYEIVVDCTDNFSTRYLINDICILLDKPFIYGAIYRFEGQISVFNYKNGPTYRCVFPEKEENRNVLNCNEDGVLGILPGTIGMLQATETIKIITGKGDILNGKILLINILNNQFQTISIERKRINYKEKINLKNFQQKKLECNVKASQIITCDEIKNLDDFIFLDVRNIEETPKITKHCVFEIPLIDLNDKIENLPIDKNIICVCQSGKRSERAIEILEKRIDKMKLYNLQEGITEKFIDLWTK